MQGVEEEGRESMSVRIGIRLMLVAAVAVSGCAQQTLTAASTLGTAGNKAALTMEQTAVLSSDQVTQLQTARQFDAAFTAVAGGHAANANQALTNLESAQIAALEDQLAKRAQFLDSLAKTYAALGALASYNAAGDFNTALGGLVSDTNGFLKAVKQPPMPTQATNVIQQIGGFFVSYLQSQQVIAASKAMRDPLNSGITAMKAGQDFYLGMQDIYVRETREAAVDLYSKNLLSVSPVLDQISAPLGLKSVANADQLVRTNKASQAGINAVISARITQLTANIGATYQKSLEALEALPKMHDQLENGVPLDLNQISSIVSELQTLANNIKPTKGS
jgi:hypothetical protein